MHRVVEEREGKLRELIDPDWHLWLKTKMGILKNTLDEHT